MQPYCDFIKKNKFIKKKEKTDELKMGLRLKALMEMDVIKEVILLSDGAMHVEGKAYWSGKYQKWYKVTDILYSKSGFREAVMIEWEDGKREMYSMSLDKVHDFEIRLN